MLGMELDDDERLPTSRTRGIRVGVLCEVVVVQRQQSSVPNTQDLKVEQQRGRSGLVSDE